MKFLVVIAAFVVVASAEFRQKRGLLSDVIVGPSGSIVSTPGVIASPLLARSVIAPGLVAPGLISNGLLAPGLISNGLVAPGLISNGLVARSLLAPSVLAAPGVTAGTVVAPGATLIGPNTNGAPGAVITNGLLGSQIIV